MLWLDEEGARFQHFIDTKLHCNRPQSELLMRQFSAICFQGTVANETTPTKSGCIRRERWRKASWNPFHCPASHCHITDASFKQIFSVYNVDRGHTCIPRKTTLAGKPKHVGSLDIGADSRLPLCDKLLRTHKRRIIVACASIDVTLQPIVMLSLSHDTLLPRLQTRCTNDVGTSLATHANKRILRKMSSTRKASISTTRLSEQADLHTEN